LLALLARPGGIQAFVSPAAVEKTGDALPFGVLMPEKYNLMCFLYAHLSTANHPWKKMI
jgi:hypothetical protein